MTIKYQGSSPRVRGSRICKLFFRAAQGIIPAGAGLTAEKRLTDPTGRDHPRGCGAHYQLDISKRRSSGSSPRVRGSPADNVREVGSAGIIPAGAGLTGHRESTFLTHRDHPRGCGAHRDIFDLENLAEGSSPRVRGSLVQLACRPIITGIIPAGAGLTS